MLFSLIPCSYLKFLPESLPWVSSGLGLPWQCCFLGFKDSSFKLSLSEYLIVPWGVIDVFCLTLRTKIFVSRDMEL